MDIQVYSENPSLVTLSELMMYSEDFGCLLVEVPDKYCETTVFACCKGGNCWEGVTFQPSMLLVEHGIDLMDPPQGREIECFDCRQRHPDYYNVSVYIKVPSWQGVKILDVEPTKHAYGIWFARSFLKLDSMSRCDYTQEGNYTNFKY